MPEILDLSAAMIDSGELLEPPMRITNELSEIADDVAVIESFSNVVALRAGDGMVVFDTSGAATGAAVARSLRAWSTAPIHTIVYTHGHVDHVGGSGAFIADADQRAHRVPRVVGHENVPLRFDRYRLTNGWNVRINQRQFGGVRARPGLGASRAFLGRDVAPCTETFSDRRSLTLDGLTIDLYHAKGETDDHTWAWIPAHRALSTGDFVTWVFPNAGNPQKVQRYPVEWARALRDMAAMDAELLLLAHGLPIGGAERIRTVLTTTAGMLEQLVADVVDAMNAGASLDEILHSVAVDPELLARPYLRPVYDEPEFVIRNVWRSYGGWWDGDPAHLKPAPAAVFAAEVSSLAGGARRVAARAEELAAAGEHRLACQLVELAVQAAGDDRLVHQARAAIYGARRRAETSLMAKGIYGEAAKVSQTAAAQIAAAPQDASG
ncbi:MAG: alkyl sulfatase dimerization domain-containing protein [Ilumatobacteraceae bacterium]